MQDTADADEEAEVIRPETAATSTFDGDVDLPDGGDEGDVGEGGAEVAAEPDEPEPAEPEPAEPEPAPAADPEPEPEVEAAEPEAEAAEPEAEAAEPEPAAKEEEEEEPAAKEEEEPAAKEEEEEAPAAKEDEPEPAAAKEAEAELEPEAKPEAEAEAEPAASKDETEAEAAPATAGEGGEDGEGGERGYKAGEEGSTSVKSAKSEAVGSTSVKSAKSEAVGSTSVKSAKSEAVGSTSVKSAKSEAVGSTSVKSAKSEAVGSTSVKSNAAGEHPDVVTDINDSPEAHAEVDEMAQAQAREVMRSRQNSMVGEQPKLKPSPSQDERRRSSGTNASVRSAATPPTKKEQQAPNESLAPMSVHPPSPSKIKQGPWLSGTYKLPKSGKIISGEELCDALLRMTNAYVDKMTQEQGGKSIPPEAATVFNTKKISQDEYDAMITRLYKPKDRSVTDSDRIQLMTLKYTEEGKETWQPVKQVTQEDQQAYMCNLYQRCLDNRKKTQEELAAKYLKPLGQPRKF
eukprot:XP_001698509.1 flagellar associated protein [Chlamydomonas reinhardtii]